MKKERKPWNELKEWLSVSGGVGANIIAQEIGVEPNTVYRWANGTRDPEAHHVMGVFLATQGEVDYMSAPCYPEKVWPSKVFKCIFQRKRKNEDR